MIRKRHDRDQWNIITSKRYIQYEVKKDDFDGIVSLLYIDDVSEAARCKYPDKDITICDKGMKWLQIMPANENYVITAMVNDGNKINIWYIDILGNQGLEDYNVAFFDDLYLDLILRPNGDLKIDDIDEFEEALKQKVITKELYDLAIITKEKLQIGLLNDIQNLVISASDYCLISKTTASRNRVSINKKIMIETISSFYDTKDQLVKIIQVIRI